MFLAISLIYCYLLPYIISLVILFLFYVYPTYRKLFIIVKITNLCRVFLAMIYVGTSISILIFNIDVLLQTEPLAIATWLVFSHLVSSLVGTAICLYKDCGWVFNRIAEKINPIVI